jgi:hypothetical protein
VVGCTFGTVKNMSIEGHRGDGTPEGCEAEDCIAAAERNDRWLGVHLSLEPGGRAHFHHRSELHASVRADDDARFSDLAVNYDGTPDDFPLSWKYLTSHPIFHRPIPVDAHGRTAADLTEDELTAPPEFIDNCDGLRDMWSFVDRDSLGEVVVELEHGPHLWPADVPATERWNTPASGTSSHDPRLDVSAATYEAAIVALAAKVRSHYGHDRSNV